MRRVGWGLFCTSFATLALAIACSPFQGDESGTRIDAGALPDGGATNDSGTIDAANASTGTCPGGQGPLTTFQPDFTKPSPWAGDLPTTTANGQLTTVAGALRASGNVPPINNGELKAFADWSWPSPNAKHVSVTFDISIANANPTIYSTLGCRIGVEGDKLASGLTFEFLHDPLVHLVGQKPTGVEARLGFDPQFDIKTPFDGVTRHASLAVDIQQGLSDARGSIGGASVVTGQLPTPFALETISLQCGILYADEGTKASLSVDISNVSVLICP